MPSKEKEGFFNNQDFEILIKPIVDSITVELARLVAALLSEGALAGPLGAKRELMFMFSNVLNNQLYSMFESCDGKDFMHDHRANFEAALPQLLTAVEGSLKRHKTSLSIDALQACLAGFFALEDLIKEAIKQRTGREWFQLIDEESEDGGQTCKL